MEANVSFKIFLDGEEDPANKEEIKKAKENIRNFIYDSLDSAGVSVANIQVNIITE